MTKTEKQIEKWYDKWVDAEKRNAKLKNEVIRLRKQINAQTEKQNANI